MINQLSKFFLKHDVILNQKCLIKNVFNNIRHLSERIYIMIIQLSNYTILHLNNFSSYIFILSYIGHPIANIIVHTSNIHFKPFVYPKISNR